MRTAKFSKILIFSVCILLVFAVAAALLFGSGATLFAKDNVIANTGEGADEVSGALVSNTGYDHGSNVKNNTTAQAVNTASGLVSAIQNNTTIRLTGPVTLTSAQVQQIWNRTYSGTIYGNGNTISASFPSSGNAISVQPATRSHTAGYGGLCGKLTGAIYDLTFEHTGGQLNLRMTGNESGFAGGLVGSIDGGTVENVKVILSNSSGGRVGVVKEGSGGTFGTNYYLGAGALTGRISSGSIKNVTIVNNAWIEAGLTDDSDAGGKDTSVSNEVPGHVGNVAGIIGPVQSDKVTTGNINIDNVIVEGTVSSASLVGDYVANIGTVTTSNLKITVTNFYNKYKNTFSGNASSPTFLKNSENPTLTISNMYNISGVTSGTRNDCTISSNVTVNTTAYTVGFDPQATSIGNSLVVVKTGVSGGDNKKAVLTTNSGAKYGDYAFKDNGSTVIMRNLPTAISNWNNNGSFNCTITISDRYVANPTISGSYAYTGSPIDVAINVTYNNVAYTNYTVTYEANGGNAQVSNGKPLNAGTYIVRVNLTGEETFSDGTKAFQTTVTVDKKTIQNPDVTLSNSEYGGQDKTATFSSTNCGDEAVTISYSGDRKNVGTFTATATPNANFKFADNAASKSYTLTITKKPVTVQATDINNEFGNASPAYSYTVPSGGFYENISVTYTCAVEELSNAGEKFDIVPEVTEFNEINNYEITYINGTLTVVPKTVVITEKYPGVGNTIEYSGVVTNSQLQELLFERPTDLDGNELLLAFEITKDGQPATVQYAGTYTITATIAASYEDEELGTVSQTNYTASACTSTLTVVARKITVKLKEGVQTSKTYDGKVVSEEDLIAMVDVLNTVEQGSYPDLVVTVTEGEVKNAGEYNVSVDLTADDKLIYELSQESVSTLKYTVNQVEVNGAVTAPSDLTYDGTQKKATFAFAGESPMVGNDEIIFSYKTDGGQTTSNIVSAGTYTATASFPEYTQGKSNYKWAEGARSEITFTVLPKEVSVTWSDTGSFEYNGSAQAPTATATGVEQDGNVNIILTIKNALSEVVAGGAVNAGTYTAEATTDNGNYTLTNATKQFEITKKGITVGVTVEGWTYGEPASDPVVSGNEGGGTESLLYEGVEGTVYSSAEAPEAAGKYKVTVTVGATQNYEGGNAVSEAFTVKKAVLSDNTQDVVATYNAAAHSLVISLDGFKNNEDLESASGVVKYGTDGLTYDLDSYGVTNACDAVTVYYQITFDNYDTVTGSRTITVNAKEVAVVWSDMSLTYTGKALKPTAAVSELDLEGEDALALTVKTTKDGREANAIDVGTYGAVATTSNSNYVLTGETVDNFMITAADFDSAVQIVNWTYKQTASQPSVTNNPGGGTVTYKYSGRGETVYDESETAPEKAGSYTVTATIAAIGNYAQKVVSADFVIDKAVVTLPTVTDQPWTGETITSGLKSNDIYTVVDEGGVEVGLYTATLTLVDKANYKWSAGDDNNDGVASVTYQIVEKDVNVNSWTTDPSIKGWTYGAFSEDINKPSYEAAYGNGTAKVEYRLKSASDEAYAEVTDLSTLGAGVYLMRVSVEAYTAIDGGESYTGLSAVVEFTVAKAAISVTVSINGWTYGDVASKPSVSGNTASGDVTYSYVGTGDTNYEVNANAPVNAGTYKVVATVAETDNYRGGTAEKEFTIAKKAITATVTANNATYDGQPHAATVAFNGKVGDDGLTANLLYNGAADVPVNAGSYTVTVESYGGAAIGNYDITTAVGEVILVISPKELYVAFDFDFAPSVEDYDGVYNGKPHEFSATVKASSLVGNDKVNVTVLYDGEETAPTDAGTYIITLLLDNSDYAMAAEQDSLLEISTAKVNIAGSDATAVYTGTAFTEEQIKAAVFKGADLSLVNVAITYGESGKAEHAGDVATLTLTLKDADNYEFAPGAKTSYTFTVTAGTVSLSGENKTAQYKGTAYTEDEIKNAIFGEGNWTDFIIEIFYNNTEALNAGDVATVKVTGYNDPNYSIDEAQSEYTLTVVAKNVTLKAETSVDKTYDGAAYDFSGYTVSGTDGFYEADNVTVTVSAGEIYTPGSYGLTVSHKANGNYNVTIETTDAKLTVNKAKLTIVAENAKIEYTGSEITFAFDITGGKVGVDEVAIGTVTYKQNGVSVAPIEMGVYDVEFALTGAQADYYVAAAVVKVEITAPTATAPDGMTSDNIVLPADDDMIYDGEAHVAKLNYTATDGNTYGIVYYNGVSYLNEAIDAGEYTVYVYKNIRINLVENVSKTMTVQKKVLSEGDISVGGLSFTYSGGSNKVTATGSGVKGESVTLTTLYDGNESAPINAGSYKVTFVSAQPNYAVDESLVYTMTVSRVRLSTPVAKALVYNAGEQAAFDENSLYTSGGTVAAVNVSAEGYTAEFTLVSDNYEWSEADDATVRTITVKWNIAPASVRIEKSGAAATKVYDGNALTEDELKALFTAPDKTGGEGKVAIAVTVKEGGEVVNAGKYTVVAAINDINYTAEDAEVEFTVTKANPDVTVKAQDKLLQEGDRLSTVGIYVESGSTPGTVVWDDPDFVLAKGDNVVYWTYNPEDTVNYNGESGSLTLTVGDDVLTAFEMVSGPVKTEYTAFESFDPTGIKLKATFNDVHEQSVTLRECEIVIENATGDGKLSAATTKITVKYGNRQVEIAVSVARIKVDVPTLDKSEFEYNAAEQTVTVPESDLYTVSKGDKAADVGRYNVFVSLSDKVNYEWKGVEGDAAISWSITPVTLSGEITLPENLVYDGTAKVATFTLTKGTLYGSAKMTITYELTDGTVLQGAPVDAGVYEVVATLPDTKNYRFEEGTAYCKGMTIGKKAVTIVTIGSREKVYDGVEVTPTQLAEHFSATDGIAVKVTVNGTILNAGTYTVTATIDEKNYSAEPVSCTYTVRKATKTAAAEISVDYLKVLITAADATAVVEYSEDGNVWKALDGEIDVELKATYTYYVRYAESENYNASAAVKVEGKITKAALMKYVEERFDGDITLADAADVAKLEELAKAATGQSADFDSTMESLSAQRKELVDSATGAVEKALKAGGALRGYGAVTTALALTVSGISAVAAIGLIVKKGKGGRKNEEK